MLAASLLAFILVAAAATAARQPHDRRTGGMPAPGTALGDRSLSGRERAGLSQTRPTLYRGHDAAYWAARFRQRTRQLQNAQAVLRHRPSVTEAIELACAVYGNCPTLWRKARCESNLNPNAKNGSEASGLFQFLPSTWRTTPFGSFSIFSPYASALAAGWMHVRGRGGEWVCR